MRKNNFATQAASELKCGETYPDLPQSLYQTLQITAEKWPKKKALSEENGKSITYLELKKRVDDFSAYLQEVHHLKHGEICAILCENSIAFCIGFYAIIKLGAIALPLSTKFKSLDLLYPLKHSECRILILDEQWLEQIEPIREQINVETLVFTDETSPIWKYTSSQEMGQNRVNPRDGAIIMYTSGTSGKPKAAYITHFNILHAIESYRRVIKLCEEDKTVISIPIFNVTGLVALLILFIYIGGSTWLMSRFDSGRLVKLIYENELTFLHGAPTIFVKMLEERENYPELPTLKKGACGSANLPENVIRQMHDWMPGFCMHTVFGMTETTSPLTIMPMDALYINKVGSSGLPIPGDEIRIVNEESKEEVPCGVSGILEVRGSTVIASYWGADEEQIRHAFHDGWLDTGDIGKIDTDGYLYILDRKKDMINRGGEKIYSIEVENVLASHPGVKECAIVGCPDPVYGEIVCAFVNVHKGVQLHAEELKNFMYQKLATYKLPVEYYFVDTFPHNPNGKILKTELRQMLCAKGK